MASNYVLQLASGDRVMVAVGGGLDAATVSVLLGVDDVDHDPEVHGRAEGAAHVVAQFTIDETAQLEQMLRFARQEARTVRDASYRHP